MESSVVPEPASVPVSPSTQDSAERSAAQSVNEPAAAHTEAFVSHLTMSKDPPEDIAADGENGRPVIWCRVELRDPENWAKCLLLKEDRHHWQGLDRIDVPQDKARESDMGENDTGNEDHTDQSISPEDPPILYSNHFVDRKDNVIVADPWPEALDFDKERENPAGSSLQRGATIIQFVTTIGTNIDNAPYYTHTYRDTQSILSDATVAADVIRREVVIHSVPIINVFKAMVTYFPGLELLGITMTIPEPYCAFYHYHKEIKALRRALNAPTTSPVGNIPSQTTPLWHPDTSKHLQILSDFIEGESLLEVELEQERHRRNPPVATYRMMWLLFKPGTMVYHISGGRATAGIVISVQTDIGRKRAGLRSLKFWHLDFDGFKMGRREVSYDFKPFEGEKKILDLAVCPCEIYDAQDNESLREKLISRGKRFWKFLPGVQVDYDGRLPEEAIDWTGRVIVDPTTYIKHAPLDEDRFQDILMPPLVGKVQDAMNTKVKVDPNSRDNDNFLPRWESPAERMSRHRREAQELSVYDEGLWAEYENIIPGDTTSLELDVGTAARDRDSRYLLCPKDVIGFDLKTRRWILLDVDCCKEVDFKVDAVNNLVMKDDRKAVIKSLVHRYTVADTATANALRGEGPQSKLSRPWTADFIKNKGDGQIFLLHGGPGVGKTYTAECIAEATRRPLLSLTCGDFGTDATIVEQRLSKWFRLAEVWGAVMLLDEADIFLERRQLTDLNRNSLVSVFLRTMEYYRGILFLTTNRVGNFDDAFISRIHSVIHYEGFSDSVRERIWEQFFQKLEAERRTKVKIDPDARRYVLSHEDMKAVQWNGREIRNAFQTAVAFAEYRFSQLSPEEKDEVGGRACLEAQDFAKVSEMTMTFKKYLKSIKRDEDTVAKMGGFR
ncbi:hypothetical protein KVR01_000568 [Diaporthe batatas]|uniref:uncharacterized protein n=1 Tax=Diaporthe batatas TaxID=748121 RepID=UPI001D055C02|nr:uncharacterized protein KVR01_000568 [Diaporthe batatas]KAG8169823.1 hypothetical protein KVR01_000568 [Diaporthe batatas]